MNCSRIAAAGFAAIALGVALPAVASAADYCVAPNYDCKANNVQKLQDALSLAASTKDSDRVLLGEATYVPTISNGFSYDGWSSPVEIVGAGRGKTVLTGQQFAIDRVLWLGGAAESSVHDLTIQIPAKAGQGYRGLLLTGGTTGRRIDVVDTPFGDPRYGAQLWDGSVLEDSTITMNPEQSTTGVQLADPIAGGPPSVLRGSVVTAQRGAEVAAGGTIERSRIVADKRAVQVAGGDLAIRDSVLALSGVAGTGLWAETTVGADTNVTADGVTVAGPNNLDVGGVEVTTSPAPAQNVNLTLTNSIVRAGATPLAAVANGNGKATISASYSDYDPSGNVAFGYPTASIVESHVTNVGDAGLDQSAGHEYSLLPGSPLIDKGDPDSPQGLDVNGNARVVDGNGDGFARRDLGAVELQPPAAPTPEPAADTQAPVVTGFRVAKARVRYRLSEKARVTVRIKRRAVGRRARYSSVGKVTRNATQGANRLRLSTRLRKALRPGRYRAVIVAIDAAGNRSAPKAAAFRVTR